MRLLAIAFFIEWSHVLESEVAYGHIYARDGFECQSPLCTRRDVTPHHLVFRSHGGGDERGHRLREGGQPGMRPSRYRRPKRPPTLPHVAFPAAARRGSGS